MTEERGEASPQKTTGSMRYVKFWVAECLDGTIRFDFEPDERSVWYDLILMGGRMRRKGLISAGPGRPYPRRWIAGILNITDELLERTLAKCIHPKESLGRSNDNEARIEETPDGLRILNWHIYQSEYERQLPYRMAKKEGGKLKNPALARCQECGQHVNFCYCENGPTLTDEELTNFKAYYGHPPSPNKERIKGKGKSKEAR